MYCSEFLFRISSIGPSNLLNEFLSRLITFNCESATTFAALGSPFINANSPKADPFANLAIVMKPSFF